MVIVGNVYDPVLHLEPKAERKQEVLGKFICGFAK